MAKQKSKRPPFKRKKKPKRKREDVDEMEIEGGNNYTEAKFKRKKRKKNTEQDAVFDSTAVAVVQIRQRVSHYRTFYYLEQLCLKHNIHKLYSFKFEQVSHGCNLSFYKNNDANKFVDFLAALMPIHKIQKSQNNVTIFSVEIAPICKYDVVCLPQRLYSSMGNFGPVVICYKVSSNLHFIDPQTLRAGSIDAQDFFYKGKSAFRSLFPNKQQLVEYTIIDVEQTNEKNGPFTLGHVQLCKSNEIGNENSIKFTKTHLAGILEAGDTVLGYDLKNANLNDENMSSYKNLNGLDIYIVRKIWERPKKRYWKLHEIKEWDIKRGDDYDAFLDELEEDKEMRSKINLYKDPNYKSSDMDIEMDKEKAEKQKKMPRVSLEELLDALTIS